MSNLPDALPTLVKPSEPMSKALLLAAGVICASQAACDSLPRTPVADEARLAVDAPQLVESRQGYTIGPGLAELAWNDPRALFGSVVAIVGTESRYAVADGRNRKVVFLDRQLNPLLESGRQGEGPGEFQFPSRLASSREGVAVLDQGLSRLYHLTWAGKVTDSFALAGDFNDVAVHPELGFLVSGDAFPGYYLARVTDEGIVPFGRIPGTLQPGTDATRFRPTNHVAVTRDGRVHVLDGLQFALVTFEDDGADGSVLLFPGDIRTDKVVQRRRRMEGFGGSVLAVNSVTEFDALPDGRLFARVTHRDAIGFVFDLRSREAIPVSLQSKEQEWMLGSTAFFDGAELVLSDELGGLKQVATRLTSPPGR